MTTFKKGDRFIPHKPKKDYIDIVWTDDMNDLDGQTLTISYITDSGYIRPKEDVCYFHPDWCEKVGDSEIPNNHIPMKAGLEMISDEHIAGSLNTDKFPIENHISPFSMLTNQLPEVGKKIDWEQRKWEASIAFTAAIISNPNIIDKNSTLKPEWAVELGLKVANKMIKQLKQQ